MMAISLQFLLTNALVLSFVLAALNHLRARATVTATVTIVCVVVSALYSFGGASSLSTRQAIVLALGVLLVPSLAVFAVSRINWLLVRPWWLLGLGPVSYLVASIVSMIAHNAFASRIGG